VASAPPGFSQRVLWQSLARVHSFDYLGNRLVEALFGIDAMASISRHSFFRMEMRQ
jgi:hypothetical protein